MVSYIALGVMVVILAAIFSRLRPSATQKITEDLYAVRCLFVNFYALRTSTGVVLFDTGMNSMMASRGLRKLGIEPTEVTHVFLTHTDYDHTGGLAAFPQAARYLSKKEEPMITGETPRRGFLHNKRFTPYHTMEDGETVVVGDLSIQILVTPGHTPGSAVYRINERILASGDLLRVSKKGAILPFLWFMDMKHSQNVQSTQAIKPVCETAEYLLTGHTGMHKMPKG